MVYEMEFTTLQTFTILPTNIDPAKYGGLEDSFSLKWVILRDC
jgi:hypothetical protein